MVGLARVDAFDGDVDAAIDGLQRAAAIAPQPETLGLLADLLTQRGAAGDATAAATQTKTVRFIEQLGEIQAQVFDRQLLRFELDHGGADSRRSWIEPGRRWTRGRTGPATTRSPGRSIAPGAWMTPRRRSPPLARSAPTTRGSASTRARSTWRVAGRRTARRCCGQALDLGPALDPIERAEATQLVAARP